jgi:hypothetical protein
MLLKKFIGLALFVISSTSFSFTNKGQVDIISPVGVEIKSGVSSWSAKLQQPIQVNPIQVLFWNTNRRCNYIPVTSVSVKYTSDLYWYSATPKDGYYEVDSKYQIEAVKLDFYLEAPDEFCVIKVTGFRDIAG